MTDFSVANLADLRAALATSATDNVADVITLTADISANSGADFVAGTGGNDLLRIAVTDGQSLSIIGGGHTLDANYFGRVLEVSTIGDGSAVAISNLTITRGGLAGNGGDYGAAGGDALGAGVYNSGHLTLANVTVSANAAAGGGGGGGIGPADSGYAGGGGGGGGGLGAFAGAGGAGASSGALSIYAGGAAAGARGGTGGGLSSYTAMKGGGGYFSGGGRGRFAGTYAGAGGTASAGSYSLGGGGGGGGYHGVAGEGGAAVGGIFNSGTLTLSGGAVSGNLAAAGGGGSSGGGSAGGAAVGGLKSTGTLTLDGASISGNSAGGGEDGDSYNGFFTTAGSAHNDIFGGANHAPTGSVTVSGTATQGHVLTAANTLADADGLGTIHYQWKADGTDISGATGSTLTLAQAQVAHAITVAATYTDLLGTAESVASTDGPVVANVNDAPAGSVTVSGTATQGQVLTAANTLADADGLGTISYQWKSDGAAISGATGSTLTLAQAQVGHVITVAASYTDGGGAAESVSSTGTSSVANINDAPTGAVSITGTTTQGQVLTAASTLADADGLGTLSYQWKSDGTNISGATASTLTLAQAQVGHVITVAASYTDGGGAAESVSSTGTASVANINDAPTGLPTVSGSAVTGETLTAATAGVADADGLGAFTYLWKADGSAIGGATAASYTLTSAELGKHITVTASYVDGGGATESVTSAAGAAVTSPASPPDPGPPAPVTSGTTVDGAAVSTTTTTAADGSQSHTVVVDPVTAGRADSAGGQATADIPLVTVNGDHLITIGLPTGTGLSASGPVALQSAGVALPSLIGAVDTSASAIDRASMGDGVRAFLQIEPHAAIVVQTLTLSGVHADTPIAINGSTLGSGAVTALVIDTHNLAGQTQLTLDNVDFAVVIGAVHVTGGAGSQTVYADGAQQYMVLGADNDMLHGGGGDDTVGSAGGDDSLFGDEGNDSVFGGIGNDAVYGGSGDDVVQGNSGDDLVQGNAGNDTVYGGQGNDIAHGGQGDDMVFGDLGDDVVFGDLGNDSLGGGAGADVLQGNQGDDTLDGGTGADTLLGGQGDDMLRGGDGDDLISGDRGNDTMTGGAGADTFTFAAGHGADRITDFRQAEGDHIQLTGGHGAYTTAQAGADTVLDFGSGETIVLANVQMSSLTAGWIVG